MMICPAIVPTTELDMHEASSANRKVQRRQALVGGGDLANVAAPGVERRCGHQNHRHIDQTGQPQCDGNLPV